MNPSGTRPGAETAADLSSGTAAEDWPPLHGPDGGVCGRIVAGEPVTLAQSLIDEAGWRETDFRQDGSNPPYLRIGGKLWMTLSEYEPCFASVSRDLSLPMVR